MLDSVGKAFKISCRMVELAGNLNAKFRMSEDSLVVDCHTAISGTNGSACEHNQWIYFK